MQFDFPFERPAQDRLAEQAWLLAGFALPCEADLLAAVEEVVAEAPFRRLTTVGGLPMSVTTTCCGAWGWSASAGGYAYVAKDPDSGRPWPALPPVLAELARRAAAVGGWPNFVPDSCLLNRYVPGARMGLHQDRDERDLAAPIVSVSLGLPATFLFGGHRREDAVQRVQVRHGDVVVWGGRDRLRFHGVAAVRDGRHPRLGRCRLNLTFRLAK